MKLINWFREQLNTTSRLEILTIGLVMIFIVVAWTIDSVLHPAITSTDLNMSATIVAKNNNPQLFSRDNLFADDTLIRFYTPAYLWIVAHVWAWAGSFEAGLIWLVPPVSVLYLMTMFVLVWYVIDNKWLALGVTIASAHYHLTMGSGFWGVGGSSEMMPRTLFMPVIPVVMLLFFQMLENPGWQRGLLIGLIIGIATNLHPVSGFHFLAILSLFLLLVAGHHYKGWQTLLVMGGSAVLGAWPVTANYLGNSGEAIGGEATFETFRQIVMERYPIPFYPGVVNWSLLGLEIGRPILDYLVWFYLGFALLFCLLYVWHRFHPLPAHLLNTGWLIGGLITLAYAYLIVLFDVTFLFLGLVLYLVYCWRVEKFGRIQRWLLVLTGVVVLYAFVGYFLLALLWQTFEIWPLTSLLIEYARAARFVYIPIYLLVGLAGVAFVKEVNEYLVRSGRAPGRVTVGTVGDQPERRDFSVALSLIVAPLIVFLPQLSRYADAHGFLVSLLPFVGLILAVIVVVLLLTRLQSVGAWSLALLLLVVVLFGPIAPLLADYSSIPLRNLLDPASRVSEAISNPTDTELYEWTLTNTSPGSLFYGCFGPETMTFFRRKALRSISHNWKDLAYNVHNRATLLPAYQQFRELEGACRSFGEAISAAQALQADYILASSSDAVEYLHEACFVNEKYAVFSLNPKECVGVEQ